MEFEKKKSVWEPLDSRVLSLKGSFFFLVYLPTLPGEKHEGTALSTLPHSIELSASLQRIPFKLN